MQPICRRCGGELKQYWMALVCQTPGCTYREKVGASHDDEREVVPEKQPEFDDSVLEPLSRIHAQRVIMYKGHPFIAREILEMYDDYYDHAVGDVISVMGPGKSTVFFEIAAPLTGTFDGVRTAGYMLIRIDPSKEFDELPVSLPQMDDLDKAMLDQAIRLGEEEARPGGDEAP